METFYKLTTECRLKFAVGWISGVNSENLNFLQKNIDKGKKASSLLKNKESYV